MKNILTIVLLFYCLITFSQSKLDSLVFDKVNQYRKSNNLQELKWDSICFKASRHHTSYLYRKNINIWPKSICGHSEDTLKTHSDRYNFYSNNKRFIHMGEVAQVISKNYMIDDSDYLNKMANSILEAWKSSPKHNQILLKSDFVFGGVNCQYFTKPTGIITSVNYRIISTMLLLR